MYMCITQQFLNPALQSETRGKTKRSIQLLRQYCSPFSRQLKNNIEEPHELDVFHRHENHQKALRAQNK